jgi:flagellar biosynthesis protein
MTSHQDSPVNIDLSTRADWTPSTQDWLKAVALGYNGKTPPTVLAAGEAQLAEDILAIAQDHAIPICHNPALADLLCFLEASDEIPPALYWSVAHILALAFQLRQKLTPDN